VKWNEPADARLFGRPCAFRSKKITHFSANYRDRAEELTREAEEAFSVSELPKLPD